MASEKITKIKLRNGGLAGVQVFYERPSKRGTDNFRDEYDVKYKAPVGKEVLIPVEMLKAHLRDICSIDPKIGDEEIEILGVRSDADTDFIISAKVRSYGDSWFAVNTPKIDESMGYEKFFEVTEIINSLYNEIRKYIKSDKKVDLVQLAMDFASKDKKANPEVVAEMPDEEKEKYAREYLESKGALIMMPNEIGDGDEGGEPEVNQSAEVLEKESGKVVPIGKDPDDLSHVRKARTMG